MTDSSRVRVSIVGVVVVALFSTLLVRLWFLQSGAEGDLKVRADIASTRVIQTESPRGAILDRNGVVLVQDRPSWAVTVDRSLSERTATRVLGQLGEQLGIPIDTLESQYVSKRQSPLKPAVVALDVAQENRLAILQDPQDYPGVHVTRLTVRFYPEGSELAAQLLGYVGEVPEEDMTRLEERGYQPGDSIGQAGIEAVFESVLRGRPRRETVLVNPQGRQVGSPVDIEPGAVGDNVWLTIDSKVQKVAQQSLEQGILAIRTIQNRDRRDEGFFTFRAPAGSAVVLDASTGEVVADASYPTYPLSYWVGGISQDNYDTITSPYSGLPMINRATQGEYAPGSTFKLVTSLAMTRFGIRSIGEYWNDEGTIELEDSTFSNAGDPPEVFGSVNLEQALRVSSDTYFYSVGDEFWHVWNRGEVPRGMGIQTEARELGFGEPTGVEVDEAAGQVVDPQWKIDYARANYEDPDERADHATWYPADDILPAVGQGGITATPLQLANAYAAFANGGTLWQPRVAQKITSASGHPVKTLASKAIRHLSFDPATRAAMLAGFSGALTDEDGTAYEAFQGFPLDQVPVAGKTGTAQVAGKDDTSLFVGMFGGTRENPKYIVAVVVEQAGFGAQTAAPIARRIIERMSGLPTPPVVVTEQGHD
jgi:penicillin-binding protein 2